MNKILKRLRSRNLQANFKQFLSVILIVFLSVTLLSGFIVNSRSLDTSIDRYFEKTNLANIWVGTSEVSAEDEVFYDSLEESYSKRLFLETTGTIPELNTENVSKIYVSNGKVSTPYIESGIKGCLIDKNVAKGSDVQVGYDNFEFSINFAGQTINLSFRITGTMSLDECADTYSKWPVFIDEITFKNKLNEQLENAGQPKIDEVPYNQVLIKTENVSKIQQKIEKYYQTSESELLYVLDRTTVESVVLLNSEVEQSKKMIYVFPIIFLVVSVLVILTTINQLVLQEKSKIGTLKSIGVPDKKILLHYSSYGAYLCGIGTILGLIAGPLIVPNIMFIKYDLVYSIPVEYVEMSFPWHWLLLVAAGVILLGYLISYLACHEILHKKPIECLRQEINIKIKSNKKYSAKKLPLSLKMAFRNIRIKPIRTIMAIIGVVGCMALLLAGFGIGDTLNHSLKNDLGGVLKYDITTTYSNVNFEQEILNVEGIEKFEKFKEFQAEMKNDDKTTNISIIEVKENSEFVDLNLSKNKVYLTKAVAKEKGIKIGDKVKVLVGGKPQELEITDFVETSFFNGIYTTKTLVFDESFAKFSMWIKCSKNSEKIAQKINEINGTNSAKTIDEIIASAENKISSINLMTTTLKTFAILLAVVVLLNLIFLILKERTREIATLKVIGQKVMTIYFALLFEILIIAVIGSAVGMCLGYPLLVWVLAVNKVQVMNFLYHINFISYLFAILIIIFTILAVSLFGLLKIKKVNMIESLKSVE